MSTTISTSLSGLLTSTGTVLTSVLSWIPSVFNAMMASPVVLVFIALALIGTVVAFTRKILK